MQSNLPGGKGGFDLYECKLLNGKYSNPESLSGEVNTKYQEASPAVSPDGSYIIFQSQDKPDTIGSFDLYVTFKKKDGTWTKGINLGEGVNTKFVEKWPTITPDGRYLFFTSERPVEVKYAQYSKNKLSIDEIKALYEFYLKKTNDGDVYWVDLKNLDKLKQNN